MPADLMKNVIPAFFIIFVGCTLTEEPDPLEQESEPFRIAVELIPGAVRAVGGTGPVSARQATSIEIEVWLEIGPYIDEAFNRDFMVDAGGINVARVPVALESAKPGRLVKLRIPLYLPRSLSVGRVDIRGGFLPLDAPGESRKILAPRLAPLWTLNVEPAEAALTLSEKERLSLLTRHSVPSEGNLLVNGGFEDGFRGWDVDEVILAGTGGWKRVLAVSVDPQGALEAKGSLRIDFGGGQDIDFWHIGQDVAVEPNAEFEMRYFIRTENIVSEQGPFVSVESIGHPEDRLFVVPPREFKLTGTHQWTYVKFSFRTRSNDRQLRIRVRRSGRGAKPYVPDRFGPIQGSVWFDALQLVRLDARKAK